MRRLLPGIALALLLAGCSPAAPPKASEGAAQKAKMDLATKVYADCISAMTAEAAVDVDAAGTIANRVVLACKDKRNALLADVIAFHQIGHPKFSIDQSKAVAEASIATIEDELRRETVVTIISRQTSDGKAANAVAPAPLD
jgi:hypothetical protein